VNHPAKAFGSLQRGPKNSFLGALHFVRLGWCSIVESVQVQKAMDDVQLELAHERISKHTSVSFGRLNADKNFTVLKR